MQKIMTIVPAVASVVIRGVGSLIARSAGAGLARAGSAAAAGRLGSIVLGTTGGNFLTDLIKKMADWMTGAVTPDDEAAKPTPVHEAQFATLDIRADPTPIEGNFGEKYPAFSDIINSRTSKETTTQTGAEVVAAKPVGFWAVHIEITEFDEATLGKWNHPLKRRNFGFITFCRGGVAIQDSPIHYSNQIISVPIVRALADGTGGAEISAVAVDFACGNLAPSVKATLSFLPVWDVFSYQWTKAKAPP